MSDDETLKSRPRFNKFECSENMQKEKNSFQINLGLKRTRSNESVYASNAKKACPFSIDTSRLNKTWSINSTAVNKASPSVSKNSANNRLKKLRDNLEKSKSIKDISAEKLKGYFIPNLSHNNSFLRRNDQNTSDNLTNILSLSTNEEYVNTDEQTSEREVTLKQKTTAQEGCASPSSFQNKLDTYEPQKDLSNCNVQTTPKLSTPANIYKNIDKWIVPNNKFKRGLANDRLQRLKRHVNSFNKDTNHTIKNIQRKQPFRSNKPPNETHDNANCSNLVKIDANDSSVSCVSPLLRGIKRSAVGELSPECSTAKQMAVDTKTDQFYRQPRSVRLVQSALIKENLSTTDVSFKKSKEIVTTLVTSQSSSSDKLIKMKDLSTNVHRETENGISTNYSTPSGEIAPHIGKPDSLLVNDQDHVKTCTTSVQFTETDHGYQEKMKMTATWIASHHLVTNNYYNPFSDTSQFVKSNFVQTTEKLNEVPNDMEDMEWTNAEPDEQPPKIVEENQTQDESKKLLKIVDKSQEICKVEQDNIEDVVQKDPDKSRVLCIVVDTNIFIKNLSKLKDILDVKITGPMRPVLYIPWMVVTELDYMKDASCSNEQLKRDVMSSIKFLNSLLKTKNERVIAQTVFEVQNQKQIGTSADDKILSCCVQVQEKYESVILLSNDLNLKNKAMINGFEACSSNEIIMKIISKVTKNVKYQKIHHKMSILCSSIICNCAKETYGEVWKKMELFSCPPWSLVECLKRFKKYWSAVFRDKLLKHFTKAVDETLLWLKNHKYFSDDSDEYVKFVKLCVTLCIHLRDIEESNGAVQNILNDITKIG